MTDATADLDATTDGDWREKRSLQGVSGFSWIFTRAEALDLLGEVLYAVRTTDGLIKIGWTTNLRPRLLHHGLGGSTLLAIKRGAYADEQAVHDGLAADAHHGREWYWPAVAVLDLVDDWRQALGLTPLDRDQFADVHPVQEQSTYSHAARGARGRFTRTPV